MEGTREASSIRFADKIDLFDLLAFLESRLPETVDVITCFYSVSCSYNYHWFVIADLPEFASQDLNMDRKSSVLLLSPVCG